MKKIFFTMLMAIGFLYLLKKRNKNKKNNTPISEKNTIYWDDDTVHTETEL